MLKIYSRVCRRLIETYLWGRRNRICSWQGTRDKPVRHCGVQPRGYDLFRDRKLRQYNSSISVYGRQAVIHARDVSDSLCKTVFIEFCQRFPKLFPESRGLVWFYQIQLCVPI